MNFYVCTLLGGACGALNDRDCCVNTIRETFTSRIGSNEPGSGHEQEVNMFSKFSDIVQENCGVNTSGHYDNHNRYYENISLATQLVIDACLISMRNGGTEIEVNPLEIIHTTRI
jgi:hypothetical protein